MVKNGSEEWFISLLNQFIGRAFPSQFMIYDNLQFKLN